MKLTVMMAVLTAGAMAWAHKAPEPITVYIGTYTRGWACDQNDCTSQGIYRAQFNPVSGAFTQPVLAAVSDNPSYLAIHPSGKFLYSVNEVGDFGGQSTGGVSAFAIQPSGDLTLINQMPSLGADPAHISVSASGDFVLVANYSGGSVASFPINERDGSIGAGSVVQHTGSGPHPNQGSPHAHFIMEGPKKGLVYVADLGIDKVLVYGLDKRTGVLSPNPNQAFAMVPPGSGPRHLAFHPNERFLYANLELSTSVSTFALDAKHGTLDLLETQTTRDPAFVGDSNNAEIQITEDGRFVYVSNRGPNDIAIFSVDENSGKLTPQSHVPSGGNWPRDFKIAPFGNFIVVAHQISNDIVVQRIDRSTGALTPTGPVVHMSKPVNFAFMPSCKD